MSETATTDQAVVDDLARLHCATSRTFGVCLACPKGSWVPGHGTKATEWFENPDLGRYGLCAKHAMEWAEPAGERPRVPERIQRLRTKGWRMPPNTVYVGRPGPWRNPFSVDERGAAVAVARFADHLDEHPELVAAARAELAGLDLACWCSIASWCHADVLLMAANDPAGSMEIHRRSEFWAGLGDELGRSDDLKLARSAWRRAADWGRRVFFALPLDRPTTRDASAVSVGVLLVKAGDLNAVRRWIAERADDSTVSAWAQDELRGLLEVAGS